MSQLQHKQDLEEQKTRGDNAGNLREVALLAYPVILTQVSITAMQLVDSAMVGRVGATELAAVGLGGTWQWAMFCGLVGTTTAVQTFVSQRFGAGDERACGAWSWHGLYAVFPPALLATLLVFFGARTLLSVLAPSPELQPLAADYMEMRALGALGLCGAVALSSFFRGLGDTKTPLYATLAANGVNVVLDYGLIFGELGLPQWGVSGAGAATAVAEWVYLLWLWVPFRSRRVSRRHHTEPIAPSWSAIKRLLGVGLPIGGQWALEMGSFAAFMTLVARISDAAMAATQVFVVLLSISFMQAIGLATAVSTLVGNYIGAQNPHAARESFRSGMRLGALLAMVIAVLFVVVPDWLVGMFSNAPEVLRLGGPLLVVGAAYQVFDCFAIIADGALRGAGDTRWPFAVRCALAWGLFLPLGWGLGIALGGGLTWAWSGGVVYIAVLALILVRRFYSDAWREIQI